MGDAGLEEARKALRGLGATVVILGLLQVIVSQGETGMGDKGKKDKGRREEQKKAKLSPKEKRQQKREKKIT